MFRQKMIKFPNFPQSWDFAVQSQEDKQKLKQLYANVYRVKEIWQTAFQQSIELWINFIYLRLQIIIKEVKLKKAEGSQIKLYQKIETQLCKLVNESEIAVFKGLKNIQKLYMVPDLRPRSNSKQNKSKSIEKSRSSSFNSMRNQKSSLFSTTKPITEFPSKTMHSANLSTNFSKFNSTISKQSKQKPRFQHLLTNFGETSGSLFTTQTKPNFNVVSKEKTEELQDQLARRNQKQQEEIAEKLSNKMEEKLKNFESDLNQKLNTIIEGLSRPKAEQNKQNIEILHKKDQRQQKEKVTKNVEETQRQKTRRNSVIKRIASNPITEDTSNIENVQLQSVTRQSDKVGRVRAAEKSLQEFVFLTKKVKLPISESLIKIFLNSYVGLCKDTQNAPNLEKFGVTKWQWHEGRGQDKIELKQSILKLNKLANMDGLNGKAEKVKTYLDQCLRCSYCLVLREDYQLKEELGIEINRIVGKL